MKFSSYILLLIVFNVFSVNADEELDEKCYHDFMGIFGASKEEIKEEGFDDLVYLDGLFPKGLSYDKTIRKLMKFVEDDPGSQEFIIRHGAIFNFGVIYRNQVGGSHHMNLCIVFDEERKIQAIDVCTSYGNSIDTPFRFPHPITENSNKSLE